MKRLIAKRKLRRRCDTCDKQIKKGDVYYKKRFVYADLDIIFGFDVYYCPRCLWKEKHHKKRHDEFVKKCEHPEEFTETIYTYMPGEAVMEPSHEVCSLCGKRK